MHFKCIRENSGIEFVIAFSRLFFFTSFWAVKLIDYRNWLSNHWTSVLFVICKLQACMSLKFARVVFFCIHLICQICFSKVLPLAQTLKLPSVYQKTSLFLLSQRSQISKNLFHTILLTKIQCKKLFQLKRNFAAANDGYTTGAIFS